MLSIDVIIPSYRLMSEYLLPIVQMDIPQDAQVRFLIIADNPKGEIPKDVEACIDNKKVILFRNVENLGVCKTRNIGIDNAIADWLLFLDDDVVPSKNLLVAYANAIKANPNEAGFFGEVIYPSPVNSFTKGLRAADILTVFSVPKFRESFRWAPTANVLIKRTAIGDVRFQDFYPKSGSSEDVDFCLRVYRNSQKELRCVKEAPVYHDWWYNGKRNYTRFMRWNYGVAMLLDIFPEYVYYTFPNVIESFVFGLPIVFIYCLYFHAFLPLLCAFIGIIVGESAAEFLRLLRVKGLSGSMFVIEVVLIKGANDLGRLIKQLGTGKIITGLCKRFDFFSDGKNIKPQRFWGGIKFTAYILTSLVLYLILCNHF